MNNVSLNDRMMCKNFLKEFKIDFYYKAYLYPTQLILCIYMDNCFLSYHINDS